MAVAGKTDRLTLQTTDGVGIEAEYTPTEPARVSVIVCHPHPLHGGSMHNNVVGALFDGLPAHGACVLRFNFRGTGGSTGEHDNGTAERLDVAAAIDEAVRRQPDLPVLLAGYSFGADVALATDHPAVQGWFAVAPPLRVVPISEMVAPTDARPTTIVTGANDQFQPPEKASEALVDATNTSVGSIAGADHFFATGLPQVVEAAVAALD